MTQDLPWTNYKRIARVLEAGNVDELENEAAANDQFPHGKDDWLERHWITNAIDLGRYRPLFGWSPRASTCRLSTLSGARTDLHGLIDWTAAHMAASRDDVEALRVLARHGADLHATRDDFVITTPLEDARALGCLNAAAYLERDNGMLTL